MTSRFELFDPVFIGFRVDCVALQFSLEIYVVLCDSADI